MVKDEGLKRQLLYVLVDSDAEEYDSSSSKENSFDISNDSEISVSDLDDCQCENIESCLCVLNGLFLNVLSKEDSLILDILIDQLEDGVKKRQMIEKDIRVTKSKHKTSKEDDERLDPS